MRLLTAIRYPVTSGCCSHNLIYLTTYAADVMVLHVVALSRSSQVVSDNFKLMSIKVSMKSLKTMDNGSISPSKLLYLDWYLVSILGVYDTGLLL